jgi:hypothetical protein
MFPIIYVVSRTPILNKLVQVVEHEGSRKGVTAVRFECINLDSVSTPGELQEDMDHFHGDQPADPMDFH